MSEIITKKLSGPVGVSSPTLHRPEELIYILDVLDAEWQGVLATGLDWWVETGPIGGWKSGYCSELDQVPHRVIGGCWGHRCGA